jgi:hypothetical protein
MPVTTPSRPDAEHPNGILILAAYFDGIFMRVLPGDSPVSPFSSVAAAMSPAPE